MPGDVRGRCATIEECYESMLGFAGQGLLADENSAMRTCLERLASAVKGIAECFSREVSQENFQPPERYAAFAVVLESDARAALAATELVLAQPVIASQLIDNLNASIHLRSLLTDLFLVDEVFKSQQSRLKPAAS